MIEASNVLFPLNFFFRFFHDFKVEKSWFQAFYIHSITFKIWGTQRLSIALQ